MLATLSEVPVVISNSENPANCDLDFGIIPEAACLREHPIVPCDLHLMTLLLRYHRLCLLLPLCTPHIP